MLHRSHRGQPLVQLRCGVTEAGPTAAPYGAAAAPGSYAGEDARENAALGRQL